MLLEALAQKLDRQAHLVVARLVEAGFQILDAQVLGLLQLSHLDLVVVFHVVDGGLLGAKLLLEAELLLALGGSGLPLSSIELMPKISVGELEVVSLAFRCPGAVEQLHLALGRDRRVALGLRRLQGLEQQHRECHQCNEDCDADNADDNECFVSHEVLL